MVEKVENCSKEVLKKISFFGFLTEEEASVFSSYLAYTRYPKGSILFKEGDEKNFMVYLISGKLEAQKSTKFMGKPVILAQFHPGTFVGEMSFVDKNPRSTSVIAIEDSEACLLSREKFDSLLLEHPCMGNQMLQAIIYILSLRLRKADERVAALI